MVVVDIGKWDCSDLEARVAGGSLGVVSGSDRCIGSLLEILVFRIWSANSLTSLSSSDGVSGLRSYSVASLCTGPR